MYLDFAFICDYAERSGKLNALGIGFDSIPSPSLPHVHPLFFLAGQLRATVTEQGVKPIEVHLIDEDGAPVVPVIGGSVTIAMPAGILESIIPIAISFYGVTFQKYGTHSVRLVVNGNEMKSIPLRIVQMPATT